MTVLIWNEPYYMFFLFSFVYSLNMCFLKDGHCEVLASILSSDDSHLRELDLRDNDLQDSGVELLCSGLKSSQCTLEILRYTHTHTGL